MCVNYRPLQRKVLEQVFGLPPPRDEWPDEAWPLYRAPMIRLGVDGPEVVLAKFGLIPYWARDETIGRRTVNARIETVGSKPSYRHPWRKAQFCVIPMESFFEPCWETGKAVRWRIERADGQPLAIAGIWESWRNRQTGAPELSFSALTLNADGHAILGRMHGPDDEKRMLAILDLDETERWLTSHPEFARSLIRQYPAEALHAEPAPRPPRGKKT